MRALRKEGIQVWPFPVVMENLGAKDALAAKECINKALYDTFSLFHSVSDAEKALG